MLNIKIDTKKKVDGFGIGSEYSTSKPSGGEITPTRGEYAGTEELELNEEELYEKKDRCYKLAKRKFDVFPSAYAGSFIARCRKGKISKRKKK